MYQTLENFWVVMAAGVQLKIHRTCGWWRHVQVQCYNLWRRRKNLWRNDELFSASKTSTQSKCCGVFWNRVVTSVFQDFYTPNLPSRSTGRLDQIIFLRAFNPVRTDMNRLRDLAAENVQRRCTPLTRNILRALLPTEINFRGDKCCFHQTSLLKTTMCRTIKLSDSDIVFPY